MRSASSTNSLAASIALAIVASLSWPAARLSSQGMSVAVANGALQVRAPGFRFIDGTSLARLKDGQSVSVDLEISVLAKPGAAPAAQRRQAFVLSYDLWEERFAVALPVEPARSISHLTPTAAEAWCLQQLTVPVGALGPLARDLPFWVRLGYRVLNGSTPPQREDNDGLTLGRLIDLLSPRRKVGELSHSVEAGPFRIQ